MRVYLLPVDIKQAIGQGFSPTQATAIVIREFNKYFPFHFFCTP